MSSDMLQLLVLAGVAVFLVLRLKSVLGTRDGFEPTLKPVTAQPEETRHIIEEDHADIYTYVDPNTEAARQLVAMKSAEPEFNLRDFMSGARQAYEMILMAFETGDRDGLRPFLAPELYAEFEAVIAAREAQALTVDAEFIGISDIKVLHASFMPATGEAEITMRFHAELVSEMRNAAGEVVEGDKAVTRKERSDWTFARIMGTDDLNWTLVATEA